MNRKSKRNLYGRVGIFVIGFAFFFLGLGSLLQGKISYPHYWGGLVFAPILLLVGGAAM